MEPGIFEGLKVIDCASFIAAPAAATILSDFGASVIKIEPPGTGDPFRNLASLPGYPVSEHNYGWLLQGRNKRSLALNLAKPAGQAVLHKLAREADVFITNYPPSVRRKLGVTLEHIAPLNERLIYASFTGYGEVGAEADKPGFDSNAWWARSGLMDMVRADAATSPARSVPGMGDHPSSLALYGAVLTALYRRERTGKGGEVSTSLLANGMWANAIFAQARLSGAKVDVRPPREDAASALTNHYQTRDGRWLIQSLLNEEQQWPVFAKCIGRAELMEDPRFAATKPRRANSQALVKILDEAFGGKDLAVWRSILDEAGLIFGVVTVMDDILEDRQMRAAEVLVPIVDSQMLTVDSPLRVSGADKVRPRLAPKVGEHSDEILREAGLSAAEIGALREAGVVG